MKTERAKGTKEYSPEEKIIKDKIVNTITKIFQLYGFYPIETPTLQRYDLLASKYAGGSEILKETFSILKKLKDVIPKQQFQISLQATISGKVIAREDISAFRKNVLAKNRKVKKNVH